MQQIPMTWRDLLAEILSDPEEEQRITGKLKVHRITIWRWANNESTPVRYKLRELIREVPDQHREQLRQLIAQEFQDFLSTEPDGSHKEIPSWFYALALRALRDTSNRFWTECSLVLQQAAKQLDPAHEGLELIVVRCMPPRPEGKIRSLREVAMLGTKRSMRNDLQSRSYFLGAESLAGYAVSNTHEGVVQNIEENRSLLPVHHVQDERSAAAFPLLRERKVAGCLLTASTQVDFFTPPRLKLLDFYADLTAEAFHEEEFFSPSTIELQVMPPYEIQLQAYATFRDRVNALLTQDGSEEGGLNAIRAEQLVRQQLEEEFLRWHTPQGEGMASAR
jgi:hypothetical protein